MSETDYDAIAAEILADFDCDCVGVSVAVAQRMRELVAEKDKQIKHYVESLVRLNAELAALRQTK